MLFNSVAFVIFLPVVFCVYWFVLNRKLVNQNVFLLISSYFFYGWWDPRFLLLIIFSTGLDYIVALKIDKAINPRIRKRWLALSLIANLGTLGAFKYFNFFIDSFCQFLSLFGFDVTYSWSLNIILPVGISFYTFQTLSYTIDVYRNKLKPTNDFIAFGTYVAFFPQLVAGPIERAAHLLPQMLKPRYFDYALAVKGMRLILWGMFKKVVIADSLAPIVNSTFLNYQELHSGDLLTGSIFFSIQIYCDFSGYSDIAIGVSNLFGFDLMSNFKFPYFSRNIGEFWKRWHISLSTWFRDYLYIPLGGSRGSKTKAVRNVFVIFVVSGFWHGANWTFIVWGGIHAIMYIPIFIWGNNRSGESIIGTGTRIQFREVLLAIGTFAIVTLSWVFFRSASVSDALEYFYHLWSDGIWTLNHLDKYVLIFFLLGLDWIFRRDERNPLSFRSSIIRWSSYVVFTIWIVFAFYNSESSDFIYFQF